MYKNIAKGPNSGWIFKNDLFYQDLNSKTKTLNYDNNYGDIEVNIDLLKKKLI